MKFKSLQVQIEGHEPTPVAQELYDEMALVDQAALKQLVDIKKRLVKFGLGTNEEFILTLLYAADNKLPIWLGGNEFPSTVKVEGQAVSQPAPQVDVVDIDAEIAKAIARANAGLTA